MSKHHLMGKAGKAMEKEIKAAKDKKDKKDKRTAKLAKARKAASKALAQKAWKPSSEMPDAPVKKAKRSKFKCATNGKYEWAYCGKPIRRGETIRFVDVKFADGSEERYTFCCKTHRDEFCDGHGIPQ